MRRSPNQRTTRRSIALHVTTQAMTMLRISFNASTAVPELGHRTVLAHFRDEDSIRFMISWESYLMRACGYTKRNKQPSKSLPTAPSRSRSAYRPTFPAKSHHQPLQMKLKSLSSTLVHVRYCTLDPPPSRSTSISEKLRVRGFDASWPRCFSSSIRRSKRRKFSRL